MLCTTLSAISAGVIIPKLLKRMGMAIGEKGVYYYAQIHRTRLNSYIHTLGMPFAMYGMFLWIPGLLPVNVRQHIKVQRFIYIMYITHYLGINYNFGFCTAYLYAFSLFYANLNTWKESLKNSKNFKNELFIRGISIAFYALFLQEVLGHWLSGDPQSRLEAIPNAMMYAPYYSVAHIFRNYSKSG